MDGRGPTTPGIAAGGWTNPSEKYSSNWIISHLRKFQKYLSCHHLVNMVTDLPTYVRHGIILQLFGNFIPPLEAAAVVLVLPGLPGRHGIQLPLCSPTSGFDIKYIFQIPLFHQLPLNSNLVVNISLGFVKQQVRPWKVTETQKERLVY